MFCENCGSYFWEVVLKIILLLKDIARNGNDGIGKPEPLRHREGWSRRVDDVNRLVYQRKLYKNIIAII